MFPSKKYFKYLLLLLLFGTSQLAVLSAQETTKVYLVNMDSVAAFSELGKYKDALVDSIFEGYADELYKSLDSLMNDYQVSINSGSCLTPESWKEKETYFIKWQKRLELESEKIELIPATTDTMYASFVEKIVTDLYKDHFDARHILLSSNAGYHFGYNYFLTEWFIREINNKTSLSMSSTIRDNDYNTQLKVLITNTVEHLMLTYSPKPDIHELTTKMPE
ncbi:MAG: hypothetical protein AAGJ93_12610 [Bacteroidota bacterium]